MKKLFTLICLCMLAASTSWAQQVYTEFVEETGTLTFYYDKKMSSRSGITEVYDPNDYLRFSGYENKVRKAVIDLSMKDAPLTSTKYMFTAKGDNISPDEYLLNMTAIEGLENLNTANVTDMSYMFRGCSALTSLDLSSFHTAKVTDMRNMFYGCSSLTSLDLSSFKTANVRYMISMFNGCEHLTSLDLRLFNTANAGYMESMFRDCSSLTSLDLSSFNTANVMTMGAMFSGCSSLTSLDLSSFNTANVTGMRNMFYGCRALTSLDLSSFNTAKVLYMSDMFRDCSALTSLDLSSFDNANVSDMHNMFYGCRALTSLNLSSFKTAKVRNMESMFRDCSALTSLDLRWFNTARVEKMESMFENCSNLTTIFCDNDWSTSSALQYSEYMFTNCTALVGGMGTKYDSYYTDVTYARPDDGTSSPGYFTEKGVILEPEIYTEFVEATNTLTFYYDMNRYSHSGITEVYDPIDTPEEVRFFGYKDRVRKAFFDPSMKDAPLTSTMGMFYRFDRLESIEGLENLNTENVTNMVDMFYDCRSLTSLDLSSFNTAKVTDMSHMFYGCRSLTSLDLSSFHTAKVTDMSYMFDFCSSLTSLDLRSFNPTNVRIMGAMFSGCTNLRTIFCDDDWSSSSVLISSSSMFRDCEALVGGKGTKFDSNVIDATYARPDGGTSKPGYFTKYGAEVYTEFDESTGTLTYYYDNKRDERKGVTEVYDPINTPDAVRFNDYNHKIVKAVIDPSMKNAPLTSTNGMFYGNMNSETIKIQSLYNMTTIEGLWNLNTAIMTDMQSMFFSCSALTMLDLSSFNTSKVTSMNGMFLGCNKLEVVDISSFDISNVTDLYMMFSGCSKLKTIYCSNDWSTSSARSDYMFSVCNSLVGGKGTVFDGKVIDNTYARPDGGTDAPGYFTDDSMTRINSLTPALSKGEGAIYNLSGQRVNRPVQKGLYIINGKKMMVK